MSETQRVVLTDVANELVGHFALEALLDRILHHALSVTGRSSGVVRVHDVPDDAGPSDATEVVLNVADEDEPALRALLCETASLRGPQAYGHYRPRSAGTSRPGVPTGLPAAISFPVVWDGAVIGTCAIYGPEGRDVPDEQELEGIFVLSKHAAIAITYARTHARAAERGVELAVLSERERATELMRTTIERELTAVRRDLDPTRLSPTDPRSLHATLWNARRRVEAALARIGTLPVTDTRRDLAFADHVSLELTWAESRGVSATDLSVIGTAYPLAAGLDRKLLQIVREAIVNVVLHARARRLRAAVIYGDSEFAVIVDDDGIGFTGRPKPDSALSVAVAAARELGIDAEIDATAGWGTRIRISAPRACVDPEPARSSPRSVLVVAEQVIVRSGLVRLLTADDLALTVVGEVSGIGPALAVSELLRPDAVVAAAADGTAHLTKLCFRLRDQNPDVKIILVAETAGDDERTLALRVGASAVVAVNGGEPGDLARRVGAAVLDEPALLLTGEGAFTPREREVHELIRCGLPDKQIATALNISAKTVEKHVGRLLRKSGASNRTMLARIPPS